MVSATWRALPAIGCAYIDIVTCGLACPAALATSSSETPAERNLPIAIINDGARFRSLVAQVFRQHAEGLYERFAIGYVKAVAIKVGEHPLVGVEAVAVGIFESLMNVTKLGAERSGA